MKCEHEILKQSQRQSGHLLKDALLELRHLFERLGEVSLIVVVVVKLFPDFLERNPRCPFLIELLKAEDSCQGFRRQTDVIFEKYFHVPAAVAGLAFQFPNGDQAICAL